MSRLRHVDIVVEMIELGREVMDEVRQQLVYYRASVYKFETAGLVTGKLGQLRAALAVLGDDAAEDAFRDYEAMSEVGAMQTVHGECSFSTRVTTLLTNLSYAMASLSAKLSAGPEQEAALAAAVREKRGAILALCRHGTRQYAFFQSV